MKRPVLLLAAALALAAATLAAYHGVLENGFVNYDDDLYITKVAAVKAPTPSEPVSRVKTSNASTTLRVWSARLVA